MSKKLLFLLAATIFMVACSSTRSIPLNQTYEHEFLGKSSAYIQYVCGSPARTESGADGGQVIIYEDTEAFVLHTNIEADTCREGAFAQFFINKDDICYSVRTNHVQKVREFNKHLTWATVVASVGGAATATGVISLILSLFSRK